MRPELLRPAILFGLFSFQMLAGVATAVPAINGFGSRDVSRS
jgi:hypothetical protein